VEACILAAAKEAATEEDRATAKLASPVWNPRPSRGGAEGGKLEGKRAAMDEHPRLDAADDPTSHLLCSRRPADHPLLPVRPSKRLRLSAEGAELGADEATRTTPALSTLPPRNDTSSTRSPHALIARAMEYNYKVSPTGNIPRPVLSSQPTSISSTRLPSTSPSQALLTPPPRNRSRLDENVDKYEDGVPSSGVARPDVMDVDDVVEIDSVTVLRDEIRQLKANVDQRKILAEQYKNGAERYQADAELCKVSEREMVAKVQTIDLQESPLQPQVEAHKDCTVKVRDVKVRQEVRELQTKERCAREDKLAEQLEEAQTHGKELLVKLNASASYARMLEPQLAETRTRKSEPVMRLQASDNNLAAWVDESGERERGLDRQLGETRDYEKEPAASKKELAAQLLESGEREKRLLAQLEASVSSMQTMQVQVAALRSHTETLSTQLTASHNRESTLGGLKSREETLVKEAALWKDKAERLAAREIKFVARLPSLLGEQASLLNLDGKCAVLRLNKL
jgi:hypothetical protein